MKRKRLFLLMLIMAMIPFSSVNVYGDDPEDINLEMGYEDPDYPSNDFPKSPIIIPHVGIDGYTLYFYTPCDGCVLRLSDENDNVVYSTVIPTGAATLILPSYLSGNYKIEIDQGFYCFWGYIEL